MGTTGIIQALPAICRRCRRCIRECPVKAIRVTETLLEIDAERCVYCGQCVAACSQAALSDKVSADAVLGLVNSAPTVAIVSFEAMSMWPRRTLPMWRDALSSLGFHAVESGGVGKDLVAAAYRSLLADNALEQALIRSSCPVIVRYVERFRPDLVGLLAPIVSPHAAQARLITELYPERPQVVVITPCLATKASVEQRDNDFIGSLSPLELTTLLPGEPQVRGGGQCRTRFERPDERVFAARGLSEAIDILSEWDPGQAGVGFYDLLACGRCAADFTWPFTRGAPAIAPTAVDAELAGTVTRASSFSARPIAEDPVDAERLKAVLFDAGLGEREWRLNCTICGYPACEDHARAVIRGYSDWSACLPLQKRRFAAATAEIRESAPVDPLTGLVHRQAVLRTIESERQRSNRYRGALSLLVLEIDGWRALVEQYGREAADKILVLLAQLVSRNIRAIDTPARCGASRFAVVLPEAGERDARLVAEKLKERAAGALFWVGGDTAVRLTLTTTVAQIGESETDPAAVLSRAEKALKQDGNRPHA